METVSIDIWHVILDSGVVVKLVLLLLILCSIISWTIIFKKQKMFRKTKIYNREFLDIYLNSNSLSEVTNKIGHIKFSPYKRMFEHGHKELLKVKEAASRSGEEESVKSHFQSFGFGVIERSLQKGVNETNLKIESLLAVLASISTVTPFIGLFGTVWGIINSFTGLASGGATLDAVAPGIAEALVATAVGLFAAIPASWFYNYYSNKVSVINTQMETFGQEFINVVERSLLKD